MRQQFTTEIRITGQLDEIAPDLLARASGLSKTRVKEAMNKGAVWLIRGARKPQRLRRVTAPLQRGDRLQLFYDSDVLDRVPATASLVADHRRYSVWHKPAGLLVEGSRFGDHATLLRQIEQYFAPVRRAWLVHRLDLEASGLVLIAHTPQAAARLSTLFQQRAVHKQYLIEVRGVLGTPGARGRLDSPLDGKAATTDYRIVEVAPAQPLTRVEVTMSSGRYHQIRRHFAAAGHPVLGDPKYGDGNAHPAGLRLAAVSLAFEDPWQHGAVEFSIAAQTRAAWGWPARE